MEDKFNSLIFLSIAFAAKDKKVDISEISDVADGINHSIPSLIEIRNSILWLMKKDLVLEKNEKFWLTEKGETVFNKAKSDERSIFDIWKNLEL